MRGSPPARDGGEESLGARQIRGHRLLDQHRQAAPERPHPELGGSPVVGEDQDGVEIGALEERVVGGMKRHAPVLAGQTLPQPWRRLGDGHQLAELAGRDRGEVAPDVVVVEPEDADTEPRRHATPSASGRPGLIAAVDPQHLARDVAARVRHEVRDGVGDVLRPPVAL